MNNRRSIGVNFLGNRTEIAVWAPLAESVELISMRENEKIPLKKDGSGNWMASTELLKVGDFYKFRIDDEKELPDPASLSQPEGVHGPSEVVDLNSFEWHEENWENFPLGEYIIYELHIGAFTPEGTFEGLEKKLDYLKELGINAIEIMPVAQFPGNRNWGYDGVYPFAVQNTYGGFQGLQHLVNACHRKGLAVILDVVYNHLGPEGNYLGEYGPYFTDKYNTPWGMAVNFDDKWCEGVRNYVIENALMWFRDFHIDALRLDAVHAIKDNSTTHILKEIRQKLDELMKETGRKHYLIAESDLNDTKYINLPNDGGYGMDAQWVDEFHHALRVTAGQPRTGYYTDFEGFIHLIKSYRDAYVFDGTISSNRGKDFGTRTDNNPGNQFIVFSQNHDQTGNRMLGERTSQLVSFEMQKLMAGAVMVSPYIPMLFMGEEYSPDEPFQYFVSHTDPQLVEAVRNGRKAEFKEFHDKGEAPDPQSEETFNRSKFNWEAINKKPHQVMLQFYIKLINVRRLYRSLSNPNRQNMKLRHEEESQTVSIHRWHEKEHVLVFMNFSKNIQNVQTPLDRENSWTCILNSSDPIWNGPEAAPQSIQSDQQLTLQPESILIYSNTNEV